MSGIRRAELLALRWFDIDFDAADRGDAAALQLASNLALQDDVAGLAGWADRGDGWAAYRLALLMPDRAGVTALAERANHGDLYAAEQLETLLMDREDVPHLTEMADRNADGNAARNW